MLHTGNLHGLQELVRTWNRKIFPTEREMCFSKYSWLGSQNYNHWCIKIFYRCNLFNSKQLTIMHKYEKTAGRYRNIKSSITHLYHHSLFLSYVTGLKPRIKCLHSVSAALMDHPLGPLISVTDADKLRVKHTCCAGLIQHGRLLLSAPRQPCLHESSGTFNCWWRLRDKTSNEYPNDVWGAHEQ